MSFFFFFPLPAKWESPTKDVHNINEGEGTCQRSLGTHQSGGPSQSAAGNATPTWGCGRHWERHNLILQSKCQGMVGSYLGLMNEYMRKVGVVLIVAVNYLF